MANQNIDDKNAEFWDTVCGQSLWNSLGLKERNQESLRKFDKAAFAIYPYLSRYIPYNLDGKKVLEIGLGMGWLGQRLIDIGADYYGIDIAPAPVKLMCARAGNSGVKGAELKIRVGNALRLPFLDNVFDCVYSLGCLHHTGDIQQSVNEVHRVLKPNGIAVIMFYNRNSFRQKVLLPLGFPVAKLIKHHAHKVPRLRNLQFKDMPDDYGEFVKWYYDGNKDQAPPFTEFVSRKQAKCIFREFSNAEIHSENFDGLVEPITGKSIIKREWMLNNVARIMGLDLYIMAVK